MDPHERRRQILDRAAEIFAVKGVAATSIRDIASAVGVRSGALYHYFPSKEAIVTEIVREYIDHIASRCRAVALGTRPPLDRLAALAEIALDSNVRYSGATSIWRREGDAMRRRVEAAGLAERADEMQQTWRDAIAAGIAEGTLRTDVDPDVFREMLYDVLWQSTRWYRGDGDTPPRDLAATIVTVFVDGMRRRAP
ncbi:TetR/AcrR family transcriptional regulator [Rhodococcus rhodnii]|nr:TetR/AcrR family transcriptional regulator [Rhodococcus rhodnii]TXG90977.1 TetR/AcrR family transcriptional regulator [Rhodococcus rhodnii]